MNSFDTELQYAAEVVTFIEFLKKKTGSFVRLKCNYYDVHADRWNDDSPTRLFLLLNPIMSLPKLVDLYRSGKYDWKHDIEIISPKYITSPQTGRFVVFHALWNGSRTRITCDIDELEVVDDFTSG